MYICGQYQYCLIAVQSYDAVRATRRQMNPLKNF